VVNATPRPFQPQERYPVPTGWAPGPVKMGAENLAPTGIFFCTFLFPCSLSVLHLYFFVWIGLHFAFCTYCTIHTTRKSMYPGRIRTRNPRERSAADRSATRIGRISIPGLSNPQRVSITTEQSRPTSTPCHTAVNLVTNFSSKTVAYLCSDVTAICCQQNTDFEGVAIYSS
jgi:hypothetical protein